MINILIIDDIEFVRKSIKRALKNELYNIYEASNGLEAIQIINNMKIDLIIMDIVMPVKGGIETLMDLQKNKIRPKIIAMTGKVTPESNAFKNFLNHFGAEYILYKPFQKNRLLDAVNKLTAN